MAVGILCDFTDNVCTNITVRGVIMTWGVLLCLAAHFPYGFGIRLSLGTLCFSLSAIAAAYIVDGFVMGFFFLPSQDPEMDVLILALAAVMFLVGCHCCSIRRHVRRHRKRTHLASWPPNHQRIGMDRSA
jgi:hypothetical protein